MTHRDDITTPAAPPRDRYAVLTGFRIADYERDHPQLAGAYRCHRDRLAFWVVLGDLPEAHEALGHVLAIVSELTEDGR